MFDLLNQQQAVQPTMVPMVPATVAQPQQQGGTDYLMKLIEYAMRKFKSGSMNKAPSPLSSPMDNKPRGPVDTSPRGAVTAENKSISDFSNF